MTTENHSSSADSPRSLPWTNPLVEQRADPWVVRHDDGYYYFIATVPEYDRLEIRRARTLDGLRDAPPKVVWRKHETGAMGSHIWAPELHRIDGRWYIYFAAGGAGDATADVWDIRMYVLENAGDDPMKGEWVERGQIKTDWTSFSLDATTFEHRGKRYLVWAQHDPKVGGNTSLFIAEMDTPWSIVSPQVALTHPELSWEVIGFRVNEGAAVVKRNGRVFITYSASATDYNYCMGLLHAPEDADLLDPKSWTKSPEPVFGTDEAAGQYGPGHNCFVEDEQGRVIMVYHARNYKEIEGDPLDDPNRHTRAQLVGWREDGMPDFGTPVPDTSQKA